MNSNPQEYLSLEEIKEALDAGADFGNTIRTGAWIGPVYELTYEVRARFNWDDAHFAVGIHRLTLDSNINPIAYQGPGEEG